MAIYANISCELPRTSEGLTLGALGRLVWYELVMFCRENLTNGRLATNQLALVAADVAISKKRAVLGVLVDIGWIDATADGWCIPIDAWREWNPLREEVEAKRAAEAERKRSARERARRQSEERPAGVRADKQRSPVQPEPEPEPEPEIRESSSVLTVVPDVEVDDDDDDRIGTFEYVVGQVVAAKELEYQPRKPRAWRHATRRNTIAEDGELITRMLEDGTGPNEIALFVLGHGLGAEKERTETAWCASDCVHGCEGDGWTRTDEGFVPCPGRGQ